MKECIFYGTVKRNVENESSQDEENMHEYKYKLNIGNHF